MRAFGELVFSGAPVATVAMVAVRYIIRDVLSFCWKRAVLKRTPDDQLACVVRELGANQREARK